MRRYWVAFAVVVIASFLVLGWTGVRIYQEAPPLPARVVTRGGAVVIDAGEISRGQNVWQAMGGMQVGSVWGHGAYVAPDWKADWLHREALYLLEHWAQKEHGRALDALGTEQQAALRARLSERLRANTFDPSTQLLTIDDERADAYRSNAAHCQHHLVVGGDWRDGTLARFTRARAVAGDAPRHGSAAFAASTPSQRATIKYFWVVSALILVQILLGVVTAHYGVEGNGFYGLPLADVLPYSPRARCCSSRSSQDSPPVPRFVHRGGPARARRRDAARYTRRSDVV